MYKPYIEFDAWCEACGRLEPFTLAFFTGGTYWCLPCAQSDNHFEDQYAEGDLVELLEHQRLAKIIYYEKRIAKLKRGERSN